MRRALVAAALAAACAEAPDPGPRPIERAPFLTRPAVAETLATLGQEAPEPVVPPAPEAGSDLEQEALGLVTFLVSASADFADAAFEDAARLGDPALPVLLAVFRDEALPRDDRRAALRLIGAIETPAAGLVLTREMADNEDPAMRALAAWKLETHPWDGCVIELLRRLKYEKDASVVPWIARALAAHGNYAGLESLDVLVSWYGTGSEAAGHLVSLAEQAGFEASLAGSAALRAAWDAGDPDGLLPPAEPTAWRHKDLWDRVSRLSEFELRGVDDSRYILSRLAPWAAPVLGEALRDESQLVRLHVAQALQRMGPRCAGALDDLVAALAEPGLAPTAARALGSSRAAAAEPVLVQAAAPGEAPALRVAAVRALGHLGRPPVLPALETMAVPAEGPAPFPELDQALVEARARLALETDPAGARPLLPRLLELARDPLLDGTTSTRVLEEWLLAEAAAVASPVDAGEPGDAEAGRPWPLELRAGWLALAQDPYLPPTPEQDAERRAARLALIDDVVAALGLAP